MSGRVVRTERRTVDGMTQEIEHVEVFHWPRVFRVCLAVGIVAAMGWRVFGGTLGSAAECGLWAAAGFYLLCGGIAWQQQSEERRKDKVDDSLAALRKGADEA